jgi:branched-chain amino acid transport system substrate-binding protein
MRRCVLLLLPALCAACGDTAVPRVGAVVSTSPVHAAAIALADHTRDGLPPMEVIAHANPSPGTADPSLMLAESLVRDRGVVAVVGHSSSTVSLATSQIYNAARVVQVAPTSTAPAYSDAGPYSFRLVPSDVEQARFMADAVRTGWPRAHRIAVIHENDDYGRGLYRSLDSHLEGVVFRGLYAEIPDTTHITALAERLVAAGPDVLIWIGRPGRLRIMLAAIRPDLGLMQVICSDACDDPVFYDNDGGAYTGVRFVRFIDPEAPDAALQAFRREYERRSTDRAAAEAVLTYDAVRLIGQAIADGARTGEAVRRYLDSLGRSRPAYAGLAGPIQFNEYGDAQRPYMLADVMSDGVVGVLPLGDR